MAAGAREFLSQMRLPGAAQIRAARRAFDEIDDDDPRSLLWIGPSVALSVFYPYNYLVGVAQNFFRPSENIATSIVEAVVFLIVVGSSTYNVASGFSMLDVRFWYTGTPKTQRVDEKFQVREGDRCSYARDIPDRLLETPIADGLTNDEVIERRLAYGSNESVPTTPWSEFLFSTWSNPFHLQNLAVLLHAAVHRRPLHCLLNVIFLGLCLCVNALVHESRNKSIDEHTWDPSEPSLAIREGKIVQVAAKDLVPGDIVHISEGSRIPADSFVETSGSPVWVKQRGIHGTNAGLPQRTPDGQRCHVTEEVIEGDAFLTVVATGARTQNGRLAGTQPRNYYKVSEYTTELRSAGSVVATVIAASTLLMLAPPVESGRWVSAFKLFTNLGMVGLQLIPSGNDAVNTTIHASQLATMHLVDSVAGISVQVLSGIDVLCVNKIGTVTDDDPTILRPLFFGCTIEDLMLAAALTRHGNVEEHNATERAISKVLHRYPLVKASLVRHSMLDWQWNKKLDTSQSLIESPNGDRILFVRGTAQALRT